MSTSLTLSQITEAQRCIGLLRKARIMDLRGLPRDKYIGARVVQAEVEADAKAVCDFLERLLDSLPPQGARP